MTQTTMTQTEPTTEPSHRGWWRRSVPVRLRITVAVVVLSALALLGAGATVFVLQQQRLDTSVDQSLSRELTRFDALSKEPRYQGGPTRSLLTVAVQRAVPNPTETVVGVIPGQPFIHLASDSHEELRQDPEFEQVVNELIDDGGGVGRPRDRRRATTYGGACCRRGRHGCDRFHVLPR